MRIVSIIALVLGPILAAGSAGEAAEHSLARVSTQEACESQIGPGIAPPNDVPSGMPGFHASWYGQSGYMKLCQGATATATVAYFNSGHLGWRGGVMGEAAYLGTWDTSPGQDRASVLGGDGQEGSPETGWPRYNRIAHQPHDYVGPGQVAWFQFEVQAPVSPGHYRLYIRPLIEGATWMEDFGVYWQVTVLHPDGSEPALSADFNCEPRHAFGGVTPESLITDVRVGEHPAEGFDRITMEFNEVRGAFPAGVPPFRFDVAEPPLQRSGSGDEMTVEGDAYRELILFGGTKQRLDGTSSYAGPTDFTPRFFQLQQWVEAGDFEATSRWYAGTRGYTCVRLSVLSGPPRLAIDLAR